MVVRGTQGVLIGYSGVLGGVHEGYKVTKGVRTGLKRGY